jgi:hypothetical protein
MASGRGEPSVRPRSVAIGAVGRPRLNLGQAKASVAAEGIRRKFSCGSLLIDPVRRNIEQFRELVRRDPRFDPRLRLT